MHADLNTSLRGYCLCIGAAKAGTTWLYEQLRHSSEMHFAPEKELHYFFSKYGQFDRLPPAARFNKLREFINRASYNFTAPIGEPEFARKFTFFQKNLDWYQSFAQGPTTQSWYRRLFSNASATQYACDFSPSTSKINLDGVHAIRDLSPTVKIIYILRDPIERLWSHVKFHAEFMGNFDEVKTYSRRRIVDFIKENDLQADGQYGSHLKRYLEVFDRKDVLVIDFSDIRKDPVGLLRQVCDFLDIEQLNVTEAARSAVNASQKLPMPEGILQSFHPDILRELDTLSTLGYEFPERWRASLK